MKTLKALKSRREGIEKINKITRAMEVIAATRLRRCEERALRFRLYLEAQQKIVENLALRLKKVNSLWTEQPLANKKGLVVLISSDRGFCGGFNNQLFQLIKDLKERQALSFIAIGKKGAGFLKKQHFNLVAESALPRVSGLPEVKRISDFVQGLTEKIISSYREKRQKTYLIFNKFRRNLLGRGFLKQLFPLEIPLEIPQEEGIIQDYLFEPNIEQVLDEILPEYVHSEIKAAILESQAAEEMARMVAMTKGRRNAEDLIRDLTLKYHKARQAGITKELVEIANAIR